MTKQTITGMTPKELLSRFEGNLGFQKAKPYVMVYNATTKTITIYQ